LQKRRPRRLDAVGRQGSAALEAHALHRLRLQRGFRLIGGGLKLFRPRRGPDPRLDGVQVVAQSPRVGLVVNSI